MPLLFLQGMQRSHQVNVEQIVGYLTGLVVVQSRVLRMAWIFHGSIVNSTPHCIETTKFKQWHFEFRIRDTTNVTPSCPLCFFRICRRRTDKDDFSYYCLENAVWASRCPRRVFSSILTFLGDILDKVKLKISPTEKIEAPADWKTAC